MSNILGAALNNFCQLSAIIKISLLRGILAQVIKLAQIVVSQTKLPPLGIDYSSRRFSYRQGNQSRWRERRSFLESFCRFLIRAPLHKDISWSAILAENHRRQTLSRQSRSR